MDPIESLHVRMDAQDRVLATISADSQSSKHQLDRVESQVRETNGRVRALELFRAKIEGAQAALSWRAPLLVGVVCAVAAAVATKLLG